MEAILNKFGQTIKQARISANLTQEELAELHLTWPSLIVRQMRKNEQKYDYQVLSFSHRHSTGGLGASSESLFRSKTVS